MKVGDLVSVEDVGMCLVMGFHLPAGGDYEMVEVFYIWQGKQKRWSTASYRVRVINAVD